MSVVCVLVLWSRERPQAWGLVLVQAPCGRHLGLWLTPAAGALPVTALCPWLRALRAVFTGCVISCCWEVYFAKKSPFVICHCGQVPACHWCHCWGTWRWHQPRAATDSPGLMLPMAVCLLAWSFTSFLAPALVVLRDGPHQRRNCSHPSLAKAQSWLQDRFSV